MQSEIICWPITYEHNFVYQSLLLWNCIKKIYFNSYAILRFAIHFYAPVIHLFGYVRFQPHQGSPSANQIIYLTAPCSNDNCLPTNCPVFAHFLFLLIIYIISCLYGMIVLNYSRTLKQHIYSYIFAVKATSSLLRHVECIFCKMFFLYVKL